MTAITMIEILYLIVIIPMSLYITFIGMKDIFDRIVWKIEMKKIAKKVDEEWQERKKELLKKEKAL